MKVPVLKGPIPQATMPGLFLTTHWSVVLAADASGDPSAAAALERLCSTYWPPLYAYLRRSGCAPDEAEELTQGFFAHFLRKDLSARADPQRGRFRTFLLTCLRNYVRDVRQYEAAVKRGGQGRVLAMDWNRAERSYLAACVDRLTPERVFEKRWATTLLELVLERLGTEFARSGKQEVFDRLKGHVWGDQETTPLRALASKLGVTESAIRVTIHRLRRRFRELLRAEIAHTVTRSEDVDEEIRHLAQVLREP